MGPDVSVSFLQSEGQNRHRLVEQTFINFITTVIWRESLNGMNIENWDIPSYSLNLHLFDPTAMNVNCWYLI